MSPVKLTCLLVLTVSWFFFDHSTVLLFGFPRWAFYSSCATLVYGLIMLLMTQRLWMPDAENNPQKERQ